MLNLVQLEKITKEDVINCFKDNIETMNTHQFKKLKKVLNVKGMFDNVRK